MDEKEQEKRRLALVEALKACNAGRAEFKSAANHLSAAISFAASAGVFGADSDKGYPSFWEFVYFMMQHTAQALGGDKQSQDWLLANAPVAFVASSAKTTQSFEQQARARLAAIHRAQSTTTNQA